MSGLELAPDGRDATQISVQIPGPDIRRQKPRQREPPEVVMGNPADITEQCQVAKDLARTDPGGHCRHGASRNVPSGNPKTQSPGYARNTLPGR